MDTNELDQSLPQAGIAGANPAVDLIRSKIASLYQTEPDAGQVIQEVSEAPAAVSKHQHFMQELTNSGKSLADIQVKWHEYYTGLPDSEKHEVWQEFYREHARSTQYLRQLSSPNKEPELTKETSGTVITTDMPHKMVAGINDDPRTYSDIKNKLVGNVKNRGKLSWIQHLQSLAFGLGMGALAVLILLFSFFNERFIAPFVTPSRTVSNTPIILDTTTVASGPEPKVIIPKINVEAPVVFDETSIAEKDVQLALEKGVLHYPTTPKPGEQGNGVIFGHSSGNILNRGKYKFAFALLNRMETGDTFIVQKDSKRYTYKIYDKKIVKPTDLSVLDAKPDKKSTFTLITCDPPGTSLNRLIVVGEQISPDPAVNTASTAKNIPIKPQELPSNSPSLWQRLIN